MIATTCASASRAMVTPITIQSNFAQDRINFNTRTGKNSFPASFFLVALAMGLKYLLEHKSSVPFPQTGDVQWFVQNRNGKQALLTIAAPLTYKLNYAIQLDHWADHSPVVTIHVRAGETAVTLVPLGRYRVTIAKGKYWQGCGKSFGFSGDRREAVAPLEFYQTGNTVVGHTIELDKSLNGNMETRPAWRL